MDDTDLDLIARVYASKHGQTRRGNHVLEALEASSFCVPVSLPELQPVEFGRHDREITEPPEEAANINNNAESCIEVRFSKIPRSSHGIIFGCGMNCDVVLPNFKGLSKAQFSLTFDDQNRFIVKDLGSLVGTEVIYDNQGAGKRRAFQWIIGGDDNAHEYGNILIQAHQDVQFRIVATKHAWLSKQYIDNVKRYRQGTANTEELLSNLGLPLPPDTERPTGAHTPLTTPIFLTRELGRGTYGVVTYCWNVSNGEEHALKRPTSRAIVNGIKWLEEADTLSKLSHENIMKIFSFDLEPHPQLALEYISEGPLYTAENITVSESVSILCQVLSALKYLHGSTPQIVHRDLKPENIFVRRRTSDDIQIVLGDFGLHGRGDALKTICGTENYGPPEIWDSWVQRKPRQEYTPAVDIWSCGVVVYELLYRLPDYQRYWPLPDRVAVSTSTHQRVLTWCEWLAHCINDRNRRAPVAINQLLVSSMLRLRPDERDSADDCYTKAMALVNETAWPATFATRESLFHENTAESERTTIRNEPRGNDQAADQHLPTSPSPLPPPTPGFYSSLKRPNVQGEATTGSPDSKRQTRNLNSLLHASPVDLRDANPDEEGAAATVMKQLNSDEANRAGADRS